MRISKTLPDWIAAGLASSSAISYPSRTILPAQPSKYRYGSGDAQMCDGILKLAASQGMLISPNLISPYFVFCTFILMDTKPAGIAFIEFIRYSLVDFTFYIRFELIANLGRLGQPASILNCSCSYFCCFRTCLFRLVSNFERGFTIYSSLELSDQEEGSSIGLEIISFLRIPLR